MSYLPQYKIGNCDCGCGGIQVPGRKVGKVFICLQSYNKQKTQEQIEKAQLKNKVRSLVNSPANVNNTPPDVELKLWFIHRSKEMTGKCVECGEPSTKDMVGVCTECGEPINKEVDTCTFCGNAIKKDRKMWKFSICHILAKSLFPSVKTHPLNFIELCYYGNSHHSNFDNMGYGYAKEKMPKSWKIIVARFKILYPLLTTLEKAKVPNVLLQTLGEDFQTTDNDRVHGSDQDSDT